MDGRPSRYHQSRSGITEDPEIDRDVTPETSPSAAPMEQGNQMREPRKVETGAENSSRSGPSRLLDGLMKIALAVYLVGLTMLLLTEKPSEEDVTLLAVVSRMEEPFAKDPTALLQAIDPAGHLLSFSALAALAFGSRWPVRAWVVALLLLGYATSTELMQGLVPGRSPQWTDWFQNMAGVVIGAVSIVVITTAWRLFGTLRNKSYA